MSTGLGAARPQYMTPDGGLAMPIGDAAGWATAAATVLLAVIAYVQLSVQRRELGNVGNQLLALRAEELELRLAPQRREEYRARRKQAVQVRLERSDGVPLLVDSTPTRYSYLAVTNASDQPVRTVSVLFGDNYAFDVGKLDLAAPAPQQLQDRHRYVLGEIPPARPGTSSSIRCTRTRWQTPRSALCSPT